MKKAKCIYAFELRDYYNELSRVVLENGRENHSSAKESSYNLEPTKGYMGNCKKLLYRLDTLLSS